jgi:hypothetical protein
MHWLAHIATILGILAVTGIGALPGSEAVQAQPNVIGHVYVNLNTAGMNTVAGFDRHVDGTLTSMVGSPYAAGGAGAGMITGS